MTYNTSNKLSIQQKFLRCEIFRVELVDTEDGILAPGREEELCLEDGEAVEVGDGRPPHHRHPGPARVVAPLYVVQVGVHPVHVPGRITFIT